MQDYYNLVDVYLDAVLQPRCVTDPQTFAQEGWHYELDDAKVSILHGHHSLSWQGCHDGADMLTVPTYCYTSHCDRPLAAHPVRSLACL